MRKKRFSILWLVILLLFAMTPRAEAAWLTNLRDTMVSQVVSELSNHTIAFTTRTGAAEGTTIVVTFASAFDTSSIDFTDIDLAVGGADRTMAANCSGSEHIGAAVLNDVITFTICAGDGGAISANSSVTIEIGTNAGAGTAGDQRIRNPGTAGTYDITIGGTFGDRGNIAVAVETLGTVSVSGTVTTGATQQTSSGGGGGATGDTTAPSISGIQVTEITQTSARVLWNTNESADSKVDYGLSVSYEIGTVSDSTRVTSHEIALSGLSTATTYHFRVRSADAFGNEASSSDQIFTTASAPDTTAPVISDVQAINITSSGAEIVWATNEPATSVVDYGLTAEYELGSQTSGALVSDHSIILDGLSASTVYHFRVRGSDAAGNSSASGDFTFTTAAPPDTTPPVISSISVRDIMETSARITWSTNEAATSEIDYGRTTSYELGTISNVVRTESHSRTVSGLTPATLYNFRVHSADAAGNRTFSGNQTFTTLSDTTAPPNVTNFRAVETSPGVAALSWTNPPDADLAGIRIVRRSDRSPTNPSDGTIVFDALGTSTIDSGLGAGINYRYGAYAYDRSGNFATGALANLTTQTVCGDGVCMTGENANACPADCAVPAVEPICGNALCETGETAASCPADCQAQPASEEPREELEPRTTQPEPAEPIQPAEPVIPTEPAVPITGPGTGLALAAELILQVGNRTITLLPRNGTYRVLPGTVLNILVPAASIAGDPEEILLEVGADTFMLVLRGGNYITDILSPEATGTTSMRLILQYADGLTNRIDFNLEIVGAGRVIAPINGRDVSISEALVTLFRDDGSVWPGGAFGQQNPARTGADGGFGWYVADGTYTLVTESPEFRTDRRRVRVRRNIANPRVRLVPLPPPLFEAIADILEESVPAGEKIGKIADAARGQAVYAGRVLREEVLDDPEVERAAERATAPITAAATIAGAGAAASSAIGFVNLMNAARLAFTQPFLWFARKKRKGWGVVYDASSKVPVGLALVRLIDAASGRVAQTRVTDKQGRYFFITQPGEYKIEVSKQEYKFPTEVLKEKKSDVLYLDLYHGELIRVTEKDATISANIPVDSQKEAKSTGEIIRKVAFRRTSQIVSTVSPVLALAAVVINPSPMTIGLFGGQLALYGGIFAAAKPKKPKGWGIVYDAETKNPIANVIVRVFEPIYGRLLDTQVSDKGGRYSALVGPNIYRVTFDKPGYEHTKIDPADFSQAKEPTLLKQDVFMKPAASPPPSPAVPKEPEPPDEWKPEPI